MLFQHVMIGYLSPSLCCARLCVRLFFQSRHYLLQLGVNDLQVPFRCSLALMPEQAADLGNRKFLPIGQIAGHIMPNRMESKSVADRFDPEKKARRRQEVFPQDCDQAFAMGARFARFPG